MIDSLVEERERVVYQSSPSSSQKESLLRLEINAAIKWPYSPFKNPLLISSIFHWVNMSSISSKSAIETSSSDVDNSSPVLFEDPYPSD